VSEPAPDKPAKPAKKLPVVDGDGKAAAAKPARAGKDAGGKDAKGGGKAARARAGGWAAFTDGGTVPGWVTAARIVLVLALCATVPTILMVEHGNRILWTMGIAALPLFFVVGGYHLWRRLCPLAVVAQLGRLVGRPGTRKVGDWLATNYFAFQLGLLFIGMSLRLTATNGSATYLAGFLIVVVVVAAVMSFVFAGKTWCNYVCPVGIVEKMYSEPSRLHAADGAASSQCSPCVACKKHCPDIDLEGGYWKELSERPRRTVYFAWPGIVIAFYVHYWLVAGDWDYYFSGAWAYEHDLPAKALDAGFHFAPLDAIPRVVAAPLTLAVFGLASWAVFALGERWAIKRALRGVDAGSMAETEAKARVRHHALVLAGFIAFNAFYFFAGQPSLQRLPEWVVKGWGALVVLASAAIFFRRWNRNEAEYVQEKFAQKILKKWEWGDAPPSDNLQDIYLLHTERTKQREARLRAYKETVRELVADGLVTRAELVILDSLRAQLGITDKDHQKVIAELSDEERQMFDPAYQGSVEQRLQRQQYRRDLERLVMDAARVGNTPSPATLDTLRADYGVSEDEQRAELEAILAIDGPVVGLLRAEVEAIERLGAAAAASYVTDAEGESQSAAFVRHLALWRGEHHLARALGLLGAVTRRREVDQVRQAVTEHPDRALAELSRLDSVVDAKLLWPVTAAVKGLAGGARAPFAPAPFLAIAGDGSGYLRAAVMIVLSRFDDEPSRARLNEAVADPEAVVREAAVRAIGARSRLTRELLAKVLADEDPRVRRAAVRAVSGTSSAELPAVPDPALLAQTAKGVGNSGMYATLDANAAMATLTTIERMMLLRNVPMFAKLDPDDLDELSAVVEERIYRPGDELCKEGDAGDAVFLIVKGKVRISIRAPGEPGGERTLSELGAGACIGEMAVLDEAPRSATVRALDRTRALIVPGAGFKQLLAERPEMAQGIIAELVRRMRGLMNQSAK
jgi:hypothetical protein